MKTFARYFYRKHSLFKWKMQVVKQTFNQKEGLYKFLNEDGKEKIF